MGRSWRQTGLPVGSGTVSSSCAPLGTSAPLVYAGCAVNGWKEPPSFDVAVIPGLPASPVPQEHPDSVVKQRENRIFKNLSTFSLLIGKADLLAVVTAEGPRSSEMRPKMATAGKSDMSVLYGVASAWPLLGPESQVPTGDVGLGWEP